MSEAKHSPFKTPAVKKELMWGGKTLSLETGRMARQADGAVLAQCGGTMVLAAVVGSRRASPDIDFFPLTIIYQEKFYAAGRIPGGFFKREGRPTERETLTSRLIDRPIRPLFAPHFKNDVQVICTVLSYDLDVTPDVIAMIAASAALGVSGLPFLGPIAAARVGYKDGEFLINPSRAELAESALDLMVAGTTEGVLMVESEAQELSEEIMLNAVMAGHKAFQPVIAMIQDLVKEAGKAPWAHPVLSDDQKALQKSIHQESAAPIKEAFKKDKSERHLIIAALKADLVAKFGEHPGFSKTFFSESFKETEQEVMRGDVLATKKRMDGRALETVRPIATEVGVLARAHGSGLFTRGETQVLSALTLGTGDDEQLIDVPEGEWKEKFLLHYNFPPFSVGETGRMSGPGRREIGHGKLAWRAINPILPKADVFPYTVRVVAEVLESNGSSSMATVCATSLAMMDGGVPLKTHIAGVAMGLIKEGDAHVVLTDISGDEDYLGDMDFKVAGTKDGVTALQMDIKITSINEDIMKQALQQAHVARQQILEPMNKALSASRATVNEFAPRIETIIIPREKIREVIGSGGKVIRELCEVTSTKIDIEDDGTIRVAGLNASSIEDAIRRIRNITAEAEKGGIYDGTVDRVLEFGVVVKFLNTSGLLHVTEMLPRPPRGEPIPFKMGDAVRVRVADFEERGKIRLTMKGVEVAVA